MRLKCLVFTRTKSLCCYHSDFVWNAKVQTGHGEKSLFWGGWCSTVAGIQRDCSTCNLVETQLDRVTVTQSGIGGSRIYREGHNSQPPVVPSNQHVYSFMKRKSKQNTPACLKLNISPSLLNKLILPRNWCFLRKILDCVSARVINLLLISTLKLYLA